MTESIADKLKAAKSRAEGVTKRVRPVAYNLNADEPDAVKILLFGHWASGKTFFLVGLLLAGERVLVLSSDFGTNGLLTVKNELKKLGRSELLKNMQVLDVSTYEDVIDFLIDPKEFVPNLDTFDPTVLVWEGFTSFNIDILDEYILSMAPGAEKSGEMRHAGFTHTQQDWQGMKRGTVRAARKFLAFSLAGKRVHKIMTCLESKPEVDELTNKTVRGPLVHGSGRDLMGAGFDVIIECFKTESKDGKIEYFYRNTGASDKYLVKNRGFALEAVEPADPRRIWSVLTGKEGK